MSGVSEIAMAGSGRQSLTIRLLCGIKMLVTVGLQMIGNVECNRREMETVLGITHMYTQMTPLKSIVLLQYS